MISGHPFIVAAALGKPAAAVKKSISPEANKSKAVVKPTRRRSLGGKCPKKTSKPGVPSRLLLIKKAQATGELGYLLLPPNQWIPATFFLIFLCQFSPSTLFPTLPRTCTTMNDGLRSKNEALLHG